MFKKITYLELDHYFNWLVGQKVSLLGISLLPKFEEDVYGIMYEFDISSFYLVHILYVFVA